MSFPIVIMSFKEFSKYINEEENLVKTIFISLFSSFVILGFFYILILRSIVDFVPKYGLFLFLLLLSYSFILPSVYHVRRYEEFACMSGMLIGMTIGMISGFLAGFYVASTNGIFWGSIFGMSVGIFFGVSNGKCCGIMGVIEGLLAGFMGGLMGAMTAFMLLNDNLRYMAIIVFVISAFALLGLNYMIYKETREIKDKKKENIFFTVFWSILLTTITLWLMVFGPRSVLFQ